MKIFYSAFILSFSFLSLFSTKLETKSNEQQTSLVSTIVSPVAVALALPLLLQNQRVKALLGKTGLPAAYTPLIQVFLAVTGFTFARQFALEKLDFSQALSQAMSDFMGSFFLIFGSLKLFNLSKFANAYKKYDLLAEKSTAYAHSYPFIELMLGTAYLTKTMPTITNAVTLALSLLGSLGVANALFIEKRKLSCACLGTFMQVPIGPVTLFEDLLMAVMSAAMLLSHR